MLLAGSNFATYVPSFARTLNSPVMRSWLSGPPQ